MSAFIDSSTVDADGGVSAMAQSALPTGSTAAYRIDAVAWGVAVSGSGSGSGGGSLSGALAGAGSGASNTVNDTTAAYINNCTNPYYVHANGGALSLTASDDTSIRADSGGYAVALALSLAGNGNQFAGSIGASESNNSIGQEGNGESVKAYINNSTVSAAGDVTIMATSTAAIDALAIGGAASGSGTGGTGLSGELTGAGAGTINTLTQTIEASIKGGSSVTTTNSGSVNLTADDYSSIYADAGGVAIAIAAGKGGGKALSGSIGAAEALNSETDTVSADIDSSTVDADGGVSAMAQSALPTGSTAAYRIDAVAWGVAVSGSGSGSGGGSLSGALAGAGSGASNTVDDTTAAYINNCNNPYYVHANGGALSLTASDDTSIRADSGGYAVALALSLAGNGNQFAGSIRRLGIEQLHRTRGQRRVGQGLHQQLDGPRRGRRDDHGDVYGRD